MDEYTFDVIGRKNPTCEICEESPYRTMNITTTNTATSIEICAKCLRRALNLLGNQKEPDVGE